MPFKELYKNIFDSNEPGTGDTAMLQRLVKEHPYFSLAHFFLLKNTDFKDEQYDAIAAKTALHFNHPFFLQEQLHKKAAPLFATQQNGFVAEPANEEHTAEEQNVEQLQNHLNAENVPASEQTEFAAEYVNDLSFTETVASEVNEPVYVEPVYEPELPQTEHADEAAISETVAVDPEIFSEYVEDIMHSPETTEQEPQEVIEMKEDIVFEEPVLVEEDKAPEVPSQDMVQPETEKEPLLFEPLFATDYFASQGIKLSEEVMPVDKLGKQLKSFTEWLKTMKKVHESKLPPGSASLDLSVQALAEKSNKEEDVITETMAEVYLQQGKAYKAKEIYQKLSLLNPSKNAYFAAKIEQIQ